jgi:DNA end-binding protein Ku
VPTSVWTGSISFGLVNVPVRLTPATKSRDVSFNQLDSETGSRVRYRRVAEQTGEELSPDRIVKGYEIEKGRYVVVDKDELESLAPKASHTIDIEDFVDISEIDPIYFETPYYVMVDEKSAKPYKLLVDAMTELGKVAIGRVVIRAKERLVAIRPVNGMLCVETMRYSDEVVNPDTLGLPDESEVELSEREVAMARQLVETLSADFDAGKYRDEYREELLALIDKKAAGEVIETAAPVQAPAPVIDLMAALEASLQRASETAPADATPDPAPKKKRAPRAKSA